MSATAAAAALAALYISRHDTAAAACRLTLVRSCAMLVSRAYGTHAQVCFGPWSGHLDNVFKILA